MDWPWLRGWGRFETVPSSDIYPTDPFCSETPMSYPTIEDHVGRTPLVRLQRLPGATDNLVLVKLEGNNPAGSVKDRPALNMIRRAEER